MRPKVGRYYLMRNGEPCGPIESWNLILVIAPMTRAGAQLREGMCGVGPEHHTFDMAGCSTWDEQFDLVDELIPKKGSLMKKNQSRNQARRRLRKARKDQAAIQVALRAARSGLWRN